MKLVNTSLKSTQTQSVIIGLMSSIAAVAIASLVVCGGTHGLVHALLAASLFAASLVLRSADVYLFAFLIAFNGLVWSIIVPGLG